MTAPPPASTAGIAIMRGRIVRARHALLDAAADGLFEMPACQAWKAALDRADLLGNIAECDIQKGAAAAAADRLAAAAVIVDCTRAAVRAARRAVPPAACRRRRRRRPVRLT